MAVQCSVECVLAAQQSIDILLSEQAGLGGEVGFLCPWWYNILFLYKSATVLIAARLSPTLMAEVTEDSISLSWTRAVELINTYGCYSLTARSLLATLLALADAVSCHHAKMQDQRTESTIEVSYLSPEGLDGLNQESIWDYRASDGTLGEEQITPTVADFEAAFNHEDVLWFEAIFR